MESGEPSINDTNEPKLVLPFLKPFYDLVIQLSWPLVRCSVGLILAVHEWGKVTRVMDLIAGNPTRGSATQLVVLMIIEFFGGICIALGLFTRFFAPAQLSRWAISRSLGTRTISDGAPTAISSC